MRKLFLRILLLTLPFALSACGLFDDQSTPYGYVKSSFRKIDKYALHAGADWIVERESYLSMAKSIDNFEDAHRIVNRALAFAGGKHSTPITLDYVVRSSGLSLAEISKFPDNTPIAILVNDWTGSSGEATLLCFRGLENTRTFGIPTAGYASANQSFPMADGYTLLITIGCDVARTGEVFCDDPITPDVETEAPLEGAVAWILSRSVVIQL